MNNDTAGRPPQRAPGTFKRIGYLIGLAGGIVATLIALLLEHVSGQASTVDLYALPIVAACMFVLLVAFSRAKPVTRALELTTFLVLAAFFLVELSAALYVPNGDGSRINDDLGEFGFWFPTLYASILFMLGVDDGWRLAVGHYILSVLIAIPFLVGQLLGVADFHAVYSLSQLFLSSAVLIAIVVVFVRYTESVVRASSKMEQLANTDFVTKLGNRRQMERLLLQEVRRADRYGDPVSLLLLDIDHFKRVNDMYGHPVGDEVLREISALLLAESRTTDFIGRWGGEEFILILPSTDREAALKLAQRIVDRVNSHDFSRVGNITASIGGASLEPGETREQLIRRSDDALYQAKEAGRNRYVVSVPAPLQVG